MKPILLVKNDPVETFGVAIRSIEGAGATTLVLDAADESAPRPALEDISGVVMLGGTVNVDQTDDFPGRIKIFSRSQGRALLRRGPAAPR